MVSTDDAVVSDEPPGGEEVEKQPGVFRKVQNFVASDKLRNLIRQTRAASDTDIAPYTSCSKCKQVRGTTFLVVLFSFWA